MVPDLCLYTNSLVIKTITEAEKPLLRMILQDPEVAYPAGIEPMDEQAYERFFLNLIKYNSCLAIFHEEMFIGYIHFHPFATNSPIYQNIRAIMIGYLLKKEAWGHGYMTEALNEVCAWLDGKCDLMVCGHFEENAASKRVIEKCGFQFLESYPFFFTNLNEWKVLYDYYRLSSHHLYTKS